MTSQPQPDSGAEIERLQGVVAAFHSRIEAQPDALFPAHADSLLQLGGLLAERGDASAALAAVTEAVELYRAMVEVEPGSFRVHLASALNNLSNRLSEAGNQAEAATAAAEAVAEARLALVSRPDQARFVLVSGLINQAGRRMRDGDIHGSFSELAEAVDTFKAGGDGGLPYLGPMIEALHRAAMTFSEIGMWGEAVDTRRLMVGLFPDGPPSAMVHLLALTLQQASLAMAGEGRLDIALTCADESVELGRLLFQKDPDDFKLFLAQVLGNQAGRRHQSGDNSGGLDVALEAVNLFHEAVNGDPAAAVPSLILTLGNLSAILSALELPEQAAIVDEQRAGLQQTLERMVQGAAG
ncbi:MAG: tetratricopeptide repeat protein [Magnetospirillum sp.]|nr:MAG: tetratricopeptide repeat protein [Magnetospirillum sp.]